MIILVIRSQNNFLSNDTVSSFSQYVDSSLKIVICNHSVIRNYLYCVDGCAWAKDVTNAFLKWDQISSF